LTLRPGRFAEAACLSALATIVPMTGPTTGWSIVGPFHHEWFKA
jgi:hypothetical protein